MARGKALGEDLRWSIIKAHMKGISVRKISVSHSVARSTVHDIIGLHKKSGSVRERKKTGRLSKISDADQRALRRILKANRRSNSREITVLWREMTGKQMSVSTTKRSIKKLGFKFYKVISITSLLKINYY